MAEDCKLKTTNQKSHDGQGVGSVPRDAARGVEQALIELHGMAKDGGTLLNLRNSISTSNPSYAELVNQGRALLQKIGYYGY